MRAAKNFDQEFVRTFRLRVEDSLAGQVIATGNAIIIDEGTPQKIKTSYLVHSLIYVPLRDCGARPSVCWAWTIATRAARMTKDEVTAIVAMADYAAIAIENARLYTRSEAERRKLETVLTQTEDGVIVVDPDNRLVLVNRTMQEAFGVNENMVGKSHGRGRG